MSNDSGKDPEEKKWVETKKEYEVNEDGNLVVKKVTYEIEKPEVKKKQRLEKKDIIDLTLRFVGLLAIGIPVLLFYFQQKAERDKQISLLQIDTYSNLSIELHQLVENETLTSNDFDKKRAPNPL